MNITILGAGAGGLAAAFDCAVHGHSVRLFDFPQFPVNIEAVVGQGGIHAEGDISGFGPVAYAGHDIEIALEGADLIYVIGPALSTPLFAKACAGKLQPGQTVIVSEPPDWHLRMIPYGLRKPTHYNMPFGCWNRAGCMCF